MARAERGAVALVVGVCVGLTLVPYVVGQARCPPEKVFLGLVGPYANDQAFYLGWGPRQAWSGHLLFEDKYNGPAERRAVFNPLWLAMGWGARATGVSTIAAYHAARVLGSIALLLAAHAVLSRFVPDPGWRLWALAMVAFSSGFGALLLPPAAWGAGRGFSMLAPQLVTPDLWVVESNVFWTALGELVLPVATALLLLTLRSAFDTLGNGSGSAPRTGLLALLLGSVYPYAVVSVALVLAGLVLVRVVERAAPVRALQDYAIVLLVASPVVVYDGLLVLADPRLTAGQALYASPDPLRYLFGLGVLGMGGIVGAVGAWRDGGPARFLVVWAVVTLLQAHAPRTLIPFQLQLILGIQVPLAGLTACALSRFWPGRWTRRRVVSAAALLCFASVTSAFHWVDALAGLRRDALPEYLDRGLLDALEWLDGHTDEDEVVLTSPTLSALVPVLSDDRVYTGDYAAPTADFERKAALIRWLFSDGLRASDATILGLLRNEQVDIVLFDPFLRSLAGPDAQQRLDSVAGLIPVYRGAAATIYRVGGR